MAKKRRVAKPSRHAAKTALLVVGEGPDDQAFLKHVNQVFSSLSLGVKAKIQKESGGSPGNIITNTTRKYRNEAFDQRFIVLDSDVPVSEASQNLAKKHGYTLILWAPVSLEGALLDELGERVDADESSQALKARLHPRLNGHHTEPQAYQGLFPKAVLECASNVSVVAARDALLGHYKL